MVSVIDTDICPICGMEYWYEFDLRTGEYTKLTKCRCNIEHDVAIEIIERHGLSKEYQELLEKELREIEEDSEESSEAITGD